VTGRIARTRAQEPGELTRIQAEKLRDFIFSLDAGISRRHSGRVILTVPMMHGEVARGYVSIAVESKVRVSGPAPDNE